MAKVYSEQIIIGTLAGGDSEFYEVPDGFLVIVRDISLTLAGITSPGAFAIDFDGVEWWIANCGRGIVDEFHWQGRAVAPAPTTITASVNGTDCVAELVISGYILTLP